MTEELLIKFLLVTVLLFFIPKVVYSKKNVPYALTEVILGIFLGIFVPFYFFTEDWITVLASLGIITIFVNGGMEIDTKFIARNRRIIGENVLLQSFLVLSIGALLTFSFSLDYRLAVLFALALLTPSAGYILQIVSGSGLSKQESKWIESKVLSNEIAGIVLLLVFLNIGNTFDIVKTVVMLGVLILLLPKVLDYLYERLFSKLIRMEFTFIFVVALISAFITDLMGIHFLIGAFIAGFMAKRFLEDLHLKGSIKKGHNAQIKEGFYFFSAVFAPFYFFSVGLLLRPEMINLDTILLSTGLLVGMTILRFLTMFAHRQNRISEKIETSFNITTMTMPTLVFTFVIAAIMKGLGASDVIFGALLLYGILTSFLPVIIKKL